MRIPMRVVKLVLGVPAIVMSALLWVVVLAVMPPMLGLLGLAGGLVTLVLLAAGVGERRAAALLIGARQPTPAERALLGPVLERSAELGVLQHGRRLLVRQLLGVHTPPVQVLGRETLVVTPWLIEATGQGRLSLDEAVALVAHAEGRHRVERPRCEAAMLALTLPWRMAAGFGHGIGRAVGRLPFIRFAWGLRGVVGVVAIVQQVDEGRPALGAFAGLIVAMTYLLPAAARANARRTEAAADETVIAYGLGPATSQLLQRHRAPVTWDRLHRLDTTGGHGAIRQ